MRITLIDDEEKVRKNMRAMLEKHVPEAEVIGEASGVNAGLAELERQVPEVLFLDVEMQDGLGFDLLAQYGEPDFQVVFVTGHDQYAIKAFKYSATDYLIKPVFPADLQETIKKIKQRSLQSVQSSVQTIFENQQLNQLDKKLMLRDKETIYFVQIKDIIRCESDNNYTRFYTSDGKKLMISKTLKEYEKLFDDLPFFRVHQSHLINLHYVKKFDKRDGGTIHLDDGSTVPLSSKKKVQFLEELGSL